MEAPAFESGPSGCIAQQSDFGGRAEVTLNVSSILQPSLNNRSKRKEAIGFKRSSLLLQC
jgi:hypothetical protein